MSKSHKEKIEETHRKIDKWTLKCEYAWTRKEALKALRKVAKFTRKLAKLEGRLYAYDNTNELP